MFQGTTTSQKKIVSPPQCSATLVAKILMFTVVSQNTISSARFTSVCQNYGDASATLNAQWLVPLVRVTSAVVRDQLTSTRGIIAQRYCKWRLHCARGASWEMHMIIVM